jgi:hypothetical protein
MNQLKDGLDNMQNSPPLKEQLMLFGALTLSYTEDMDKLIHTSKTAQRFTDALHALGKCSEFYTLLFSIHDQEIPLNIRTILANHLQQSLYANHLNEFKTILYDYITKARDDYETGYYLIILESVNEFMRTISYHEFHDAKQAFDNDPCDANEQLKASIALLKQQVRELMYPSTYSFDG